MADIMPEPGISPPKGSRFQLGARSLVSLVLVMTIVTAIVLHNAASVLHNAASGNDLSGRVNAPKPDDTHAHRHRGTPGAPFEGCVFVLSPVSFQGWTPVYRAAFVQWHADFLMRSLGAQTDLRFQVLVLPGYTPSEMELVARRLRPENLVVVEETHPGGIPGANIKAFS